MSKFHINKHGVPAPCKATKGNCPLGGSESHFDTKEQAQKYVDQENERNHGLLPGLHSDSNVKIDASSYETRKYKLKLADTLQYYVSEIDKKSYATYLNQYKDIWKHPEESYDFINKKKIDNEKLKENLNKRGIEIENLDRLSEHQKKALISVTDDYSVKKTRNNLGFLTSKENTSYKKNTHYTKENLEGSFDDVYYKLHIMNDVGWHKGSMQARNQENTRMNSVMDKKSVSIAEKILKGSHVNKETEEYPTSGMIASIQGLRHKGMKEKEIIRRAKNERVADILYEEYNVKPRKTSGATEVVRILDNEAKSKNTSLHEMLKNSLDWTE